MHEESKSQPQQSLLADILGDDVGLIQRTSKQRKLVERLEKRLRRLQGELRAIETAQPLVPVEPWFTRSQEKQATKLKKAMGKLGIRLDEERARLKELEAASPA